MSIDLKVYDNGDHTCLVWLPTDGKSIANCLGFTIHRWLKPDATEPAQESYLHGFVGFSDADQFDPNAPWKFPLQRYMWWDYLVQPGNVVIFGGAGGRPGPEPSFTVHSERQRADAADDDHRPSLGACHSPDLAEIKFWLGQGASAPAAAGQPVAAPSAGGTQVRAATATGRTRSPKRPTARKPVKKPKSATAARRRHAA
jgi:hypothetical protein